MYMKKRKDGFLKSVFFLTWWRNKGYDQVQFFRGKCVKKWTWITTLWNNWRSKVTNFFFKEILWKCCFFHFGLFHLYDFKVVLAVHGKTTQQSLRAIYSWNPLSYRHVKTLFIKVKSKDSLVWFSLKLMTCPFFGVVRFPAKNPENRWFL